MSENKNKVLINIAKYIVFGLLGLLFILYIVGDIFSFSRIDKNSVLIGKENDIRLLARIVEINPNTGFANIEFSIIEEFYNDSTCKDTISQSFDLMIFSGGVVAISDNANAFENQSRYHNNFIKFKNSSTIKLGNYIQKKYLAEAINIKIDANPKGYLFPFDKYVLRINFELLDKKSKLRYPTIDTKLEDNKFFASNSMRNFTFGKRQDMVENSFFLLMLRPNYIALNFSIIVLISLCVVFWTYYRILSKSVVSVIEILGLNITILVSFPSLRSILVPSNLEYAPLFDFTSTIIWILSLLGIITYVIKDIKLKKINSH